MTSLGYYMCKFFGHPKTDLGENTIPISINSKGTKITARCTRCGNIITVPVRPLGT